MSAMVRAANEQYGCRKRWFSPGTRVQGATAACCVNGCSDILDHVGGSRIVGFGDGETLVLGSARVVDDVLSDHAVMLGAERPKPPSRLFEIRPGPTVKAMCVLLGTLFPLLPKLPLGHVVGSRSE